MEPNETKVLANIRAADTGDLLDRVTAYRGGMEPATIELVEAELRRRGVRAAEIDAYREECERECLHHADGTAKMCSFCRRPAVAERWGWHRLIGKIPIMPRWLRYCRDHDSV